MAGGRAGPTTTGRGRWSGERLDRHDWNYGFVVDGFPRNGRQAEFFLESYDIDGVVHLDVPDEEVRAPDAEPAGCARAAGWTTT